MCLGYTTNRLLAVDFGAEVESSMLIPCERRADTMRRMLNIHEANDVRLDTVANPEPGSRDVLVNVRACGICGSDLTYIKSGGILGPSEGVIPLGHEAAGEVSFVGEEVEGINIGQRVIINPMQTPGVIGNGGPEGAFTEQLLVSEARAGDNLLPIPDDIPYPIAALTEPLAVALHGVNRARVEPGDKVVVFGCGPIGLGMVIWLLDRGIEDVVALDISEPRLQRARDLGVQALNPGEVDTRAELMRLHGTAPLMGGEAVGSDVYIDAAGAPNILPDVIGMAKLHARLVVTAVYTEPVEMPMTLLLVTEMNITAAMGYPTEMPEVIAALPRLQTQLKPMISHHFPLEQIIDALDTARSPASAKVMVDIGTA